MTPEETIDQLVEQVGPNIAVPDPSLIRVAAARQARARALTQRAGAGLCAVLLAVGVFALLNRDQATPLATADDSLDAELPAPTTFATPEGQADLLAELAEDAGKVPFNLGGAFFATAEGDDQRIGISLHGWEQSDGAIGYQAFIGPLEGDALLRQIACTSWGLIEPVENGFQFFGGAFPKVEDRSFAEAVGGGCDSTAITPHPLFEGSFDLLRDNENLVLTTNSGDRVILEHIPRPETTPTSGVPSGSMSDVMLLASPSDVFSAERFGSIAASYADRCNWSLGEPTGGEFVDGVDITVEQISSLLAAIDCEGGLVVRTSGEVLVAELSPDAIARLEIAAAELPFVVQVEGPPTAPTSTTTSAPTTTAAPVSQEEVDADETKLADVYRQCGNLRFVGQVDQELVLDPIPDDVRLILDGEIDRIGAVDLTTDQVQWYLVSRSAERISVGFKRPNGDADSYTEGHLTLTDDGWRAGGWGPCEIRFAVDGKQQLRWQLDSPIEPATETISVLAVEQFCGAQPALTPGNIQPLIIENSQRVTVLLIAPNQRDTDDLSCWDPDPAIPITVELGQPLGDRELHDGGGVAIGSLRSNAN